MTSIDIVVPLYHEEACVGPLVERLLRLRRDAAGELDVSVVLVDDGSRDRTAALLLALAAEHPCLKVLCLSRNFGQQAAITAGLDASRADYAAVIDADLQDPPELIPAMVRKAREGFDIVYGLRCSRRGETLFKRASAKAFYLLLNSVCETPFPRDVGDFRVIGGNVVAALRSMREHHRYLRGMIPWAGFRSVAFPYERNQRLAGTTKFPLRRMVALAKDAVVSFSPAPLRAATWAGLVLSAAGALWLLYAVACHVPGLWGPAVVAAVLLVGGLQLVFLGLAGEYIGRIYEECKGRPLYIIREGRNLGPPASG